jgi:hypothetical protein
MSVVATASVAIHTCPQDVPSLPAWFAEVTLLAHHLTRRGILDAVCDQVHLARGRMGHYEVIDFLAVLFGYAISGEPTLAAFFERLAPFAGPFMALFGREQLPHRSTLSRFLAAIDQPCLKALRALFEQECFQHGFSQEHVGGLSDRGGRRLVIIDVDATRQAARQRALTTCAQYPAPRRRLAEVCAPGYTGRKRGEVVRSRTTMLQAHTQQWLGTFSGAGNGDYVAELVEACQVVTRYLHSRDIPLAQGLLRLDGLYGNASVLTRIQQAGLGFLTRARDYQLLTHPRVQARLAGPCDRELVHPETGVRREVYEVGYFSDWLEPLFEQELHCRVIVTKRAAPADGEQVTEGLLVGEHIYELFLTSHPARCLQAADVVQLYLHRGSFETVLADEDREQDPDRWCSHTSYGQECWQIISQWVWNLRLELGCVQQQPQLRHTRLIDDAILPEAVMPAPATPQLAEPIEEEVIENYGPLEMAKEWAKCRGRFSGKDFVLLDEATLRCPAGKLLRSRSRLPLRNGNLRICYSAKIGDCRSCALASQCIGLNAYGDKPRQVSAIRQRLEPTRRPKVTPWQEPEALPGSAPEVPCELVWCDTGGRKLRRTWLVGLRRQQVNVQEHVPPPTQSSSQPTPASSPLLTRAQRAHARLSWQDRLVRNARTSSSLQFHITLFGVAPQVAAYLNLASLSPGA